MEEEEKNGRNIYRSISSFLSCMTTGSTAQTNVHIVNYVEKLLDDRHFSVRLNANFLCQIGKRKEKWGWVWVREMGRIKKNYLSSKCEGKPEEHPASSAQTIWFAISHLTFARKSYSRKSKFVSVCVCECARCKCRRVFSVFSGHKNGANDDNDDDIKKNGQMWTAKHRRCCKIIHPTENVNEK